MRPPPLAHRARLTLLQIETPVAFVARAAPYPSRLVTPYVEQRRCALQAATMGACMSTNADDLEQKKRSQAIDRRLEEDSRRLRRECKILLLGTPPRASPSHGS